MVAGRNDKGAAFPYPFIEGLERRQQEQIYEDLLFLSRQGTGTRWATLVIAPSDATIKSKDKADYLCSGTGDETIVQAAVDLLKGRATPGRIVILEGTLNFSNYVTIDLSGSATGRLQIEGMGSDNATKITASGSTKLFHVIGTSGSTTRASFRGLQMTGAGGSGQAGAISTNASSVDIDSCYITSNGRTVDLQGGPSGPYAPSSIRHSHIDSSDGSAGRAIVVSHEFDTQIIDNVINSNTGRAISLYGDAAATIRPTIVGNKISCASGTAIHLTDSTDATTVTDAVIVGNSILNSTTGIFLESVSNCLISGNDIFSCTTGILSGSGIIVGVNNVLISSNFIRNNTTGCQINNSTLGCNDVAVVFNKFSNNTSSGGIGGGTNNCAWAYNDLFTSPAPTLSGSNIRTEVSFLPSTLDANARVGNRKNTGVSTFLRRRINWIEGTDFSITLSDDPVDEEVDVTLGLAATITSNARVAVKKNSGAVVGTRRTLNFIEGSGATLTITDDSINEKVDITISVAAGAGGGDSSGQLVAIWDGAGSTIDVNKTVDVVAPFACTITDWEILLDTATTVSVDVWKDILANYPPTSADKISASAPPNTSAADHASSSTLTGWSTSVTAGDILRFKPSAVGTASKMVLILNYSRP